MEVLLVQQKSVRGSSQLAIPFKRVVKTLYMFRYIERLQYFASTHMTMFVADLFLVTCKKFPCCPGLTLPYIPFYQNCPRTVHALRTVFHTFIVYDFTISRNRNFSITITLY